MPGESILTSAGNNAGGARARPPEGSLFPLPWGVGGAYRCPRIAACRLPLRGNGKCDRIWDAELRWGALVDRLRRFVPTGSVQI